MIPQNSSSLTRFQTWQARVLSPWGGALASAIFFVESGAEGRYNSGGPEVRRNPTHPHLHPLRRFSTVGLSPRPYDGLWEPSPHRPLFPPRRSHFQGKPAPHQSNPSPLPRPHRPPDPCPQQPPFHPLRKPRVHVPPRALRRSSKRPVSPRRGGERQP